MDTDINPSADSIEIIRNGILQTNSPPVWVGSRTFETNVLGNPPTETLVIFFGDGTVPITAENGVTVGFTDGFDINNEAPPIE